MKQLVVFHPTPFCNLDCHYCWAPDRTVVSKMKLSVVQATLEQVFANPHLSQVDFCWLTGEPLVMGLDYYRAVVALIDSLKPPAVPVTLSLQTNGTLLDDDWVSFFRDHNFVIGVSIDGPEDLHESQRPAKGRMPSFKRTLAGISLLIKHKIPGGAICVITRRTLQYSPDDLFFFFYDRGIAWSYLLEARLGDNALSKDALSLEDRPRLHKFLSRLIELWGSHPGSFIKEFDSLASRLFNQTNSAFDFDSLGCLDIVNITADGDYYWGNPELMSATKSDLSDIRGNIFRTNIFAIRSTEPFQRLQDDTHRGIDKCLRECQYFSTCRGGNPSHKFYDQGRFDVSSHLSCELNEKIIAEILLARMDAEVS